MRLAVRSALALIMVAVSVPFGAYGGGTLRYIWSGDGDGSTLTYLLFGLPLLGISMACLVGAVAILRSP